MRDSKQPTENSWSKRLARFFRRDKVRAPKQKAEITSEDRDKRAFTISLVTGGLMLVIAVIFLFANKDKALTVYDVRILASLIAIASLTSAWLARRGRAILGAILILTALYTALVLASLESSGGGIVSAAFAIGITFAITSNVMPANIAKRINIAPFAVAAIPIFFDLFEPFPRGPDTSTQATSGVAIIMIVVFASVLMRRFNTYNLRTKLIIAFGAVTVLPLIILVAYTNIRLSDTLYQNTREKLGQFANETASQVDIFIQDQLASVNIHSQNPLFVQLLSLNPAQRTNPTETKNAQDALTVLAHQNTTFIHAYTLVDNQGLVVLQGINAAVQNENQTQFFKQAVTNKNPVMVGPLIDQKTGKASIYFTAPVKNVDGTVLGALIVDYDANIIEFVVESLISPSASQGILFRVVDRENFVRIADTDTTHLELRYKSYKELTSEQISALQKKGLLLPGSAQDALAPESETLAGLKDIDKSSFFITVVDKTLQKKNLNSSVKLKNAPWLVFVQQPETAVLTPLLEQRRTTTLIFLALLAMVTAAAFGLSQLLASPILSLASVAQKIAAGDLSLQSDIESNDEIGTLAKSFNEMTRQSRALIDSLEQRSKALATSSEVSRRISTILDQQELVTEVVKQVQSAFGYYHAHIYLLDENTKELVMAGGTGEAGKTMLARGHKIPVGRGLVGRAAQNNVTVLVADVAKDTQWLPNPLLPDTKSEVAVPISIADRVLGVLDVQHNEAGTLKQEDVDVLQSIANQVAFAVRNARSYSDVQAKADRESLITSIGQKIQGTITVESAIQVAIREIGRALNGAKTQIILNENSTAETTQQGENTVA